MTVLIAWAFMCSITATDCEREAVVRATVGQGATPIACLMDGQQGAAGNVAFEHDEKWRVVIACRRRAG